MFPVVTAAAIFAFLGLVAVDSTKEAEGASFENVIGDVNYLRYEGRNDEPSANAFRFRVGSNVFNENTTVDLLTEFQDVTDSEMTATQLETGIRSVLYPNANGLMGAYARVAVGQQWFSGDSSNVNFPYWSIEPGIEVNVDENITTNLGYRYRNAFDGNQYMYETNALLAGGTWMITDNHGINVGYEYSAKDQKYNMFGVGYTFNF